MREAGRTPTTSGRPLPPLELINLSTHRDRALLRACVKATKLRDDNPAADTPERRDYYLLVRFIVDTEALTSLGLHAKAIFVMGDDINPWQHAPCFLYASVIRDCLRLGMPA